MSTPIRNAAELIQRARALNSGGRRQRIAVAAAQDPDVLDALNQAFTEGIIEPVLFGDRDKILELCERQSIDPSPFAIFDHSDPVEAARQAVAFADCGEAEIIMKGFVSSSTVLKAVLSKEFNLRRSDTLSHVAVLGIPGHHKLLSMSDGGVLVRPTFQQKIDVVNNYLTVAGALGVSTPKIALLGPPVRKAVSPDALSESAQIVEMFRSEKPRRAVLDGPMGLDCAISKDVAADYGLDSPVGGDADAIIVNAIEDCNVVAKSLIVLAGTMFAGVVVGAKIPVSLVSRTDTPQNKKAAIALASLVAAFTK